MIMGSGMNMMSATLKHILEFTRCLMSIISFIESTALSKVMRTGMETDFGLFDQR